MTSTTLRQPRSRISLLDVVGIVTGASLLAIIGIGGSIYAAALPYVVGLIALTAIRPDLSLLLVMAEAPFNYDLGIGPVKVALSDISLLIMLPVLAIRARDSAGRIFRNPLLIPVSLYFGICVVSTIVNASFSSGITSVVQMGVYLICATVLFSALVDDPQIMYAGIYGIVASSVVLAVVSLITGDMYFFGLHKNLIGSSIANGLVASTALWLDPKSGWSKRKWILSAIIMLLAAGMIVTLSRGAWIGAFGGILLMLLLRRQFTRGIKLLLLASPVIAIAWLALPEASREYATDLDLDAHNVKTRLYSLQYAWDQFSSSPILGMGVGLRKNYDATNVIMSTLAETGVVGLVAFLAIYACFGVATWRTSRRLLGSDPRFVLLSAGGALFICSFIHGMVDHFWGRGSLPAWLGAGIALAIYRQTINHRYQ